jgi:hypothetical protein
MYLGLCVTYRRILDWWPDLLHTYTTCSYTSQTTIWHTVSSLLHHLRLPPQENPSIIFSAAWDLRYTASGRPQQKTPFPNNSSTIIEVCLPRRYKEAVVLLLLRSCSFSGNLFTESLPSNERLFSLFRLSGVMSQYLYLRWQLEVNYVY